MNCNFSGIKTKHSRQAFRAYGRHFAYGVRTTLIELAVCHIQAMVQSHCFRSCISLSFAHSLSCAPAMIGKDASS